MRKETWIGVFLIILAWFILSKSSWIPSILVPTPGRIFSALVQLIVSGSVFPDFAKTVYLWLIGFLFGASFGIPFGLAMGLFPRVHGLFHLEIDFLRSLPSIVFYPMFIVAFGLGDPPKIAVIALTTFLYVGLATMYGVRYARASRLLLASILKPTLLRLILVVVMPAALPEIVAALRITVSIGLIVTVGSEMILGTTYGLGKRILDASLTFAMSEMYSLILIVGLLGYAANQILEGLEVSLVHWRGK